MSLKEIFQQVVDWFYTSKPKIKSDYLDDMLELKGAHLQNTPGMYRALMAHLGINLGVRGPHVGPVKSYLPQPGLKLHIEGRPQQLGDDEIDEGEVIAASPGIMVLDDDLPLGRNDFAIVIRGELLKGSNHERATLFSLRGSRRANGNVVIKSIKIPTIDDANRMGPLEKIELTKEKITRALCFAQLCNIQMIEGEALTPRGNLQTARSVVWTDYEPEWGDERIPPPSKPSGPKP